MMFTEYMNRLNPVTYGTEMQMDGLPAKIGIKIKTPNLDIYIITCFYKKER